MQWQNGKKISNLFFENITNSVVTKPKGSSPHSWQPTIGPYPEPGESTLQPPANLPKIHSNPLTTFQCFCHAKRAVLVWGFLWRFITNERFYSGGLLAPCPTPKLKGHPLSTICDCLFNIFAATLHIWRPSPPSATWGRAKPWWQGTHLTWKLRTCSEFNI
jgi:hypothetical protein